MLFFKCDTMYMRSCYLKYFSYEYFQVSNEYKSKTFYEGNHELKDFSNSIKKSVLVPHIFAFIGLLFLLLFLHIGSLKSATLASLFVRLPVLLSSSRGKSPTLESEAFLFLSLFSF